MAMIVGELALDPQILKKDPEAEPFLRRMVDAIRDINSVVSFARHGANAAKGLPIAELLQLVS